MTPPSKEQLRLHRSQIVRSLAALAIIGTLAGCTEVATQHPLSPERHSPASAAYSTDANPNFYSDLATVESQTSDPTLTKSLESLSKQPVAEWLPSDAGSAAGVIEDTLAQTKKDGSIPVFVSYAIPNRDVGGQSAGGLDDAGYKNYVETVSKAIGEEPAIIIVEPDAVAHFPDLTTSERTERATLLGFALDTLYTNTNTAVYLDAGNSDWRSPQETAVYLHDVSSHTKHGISGISLNVSNFQAEAKTRDFSTAVQKAFGAPLYTMIDNSRNGNAAEMKSGDWCNPENQKLGTAGQQFDAHAKVEEMYIKTPGESDGQCGVSQLPAGEFDAKLLLDQVQ